MKSEIRYGMGRGGMGSHRSRRACPYYSRSHGGDKVLFFMPSPIPKWTRLKGPTGQPNSRPPPMITISVPRIRTVQLFHSLYMPPHLVERPICENITLKPTRAILMHRWAGLEHPPKYDLKRKSVNKTYLRFRFMNGFGSGTRLIRLRLKNGYGFGSVLRFGPSA